MRALLVALAIAPSALAQFDPAQFGYLPFKMLNDARDPFGYYFDARSSSPAGLQLSVVQSATQSAWKKWDDISCASTAFRFLGPTTNVVPDPADPYDVYNVSTVWVSSRQDPVYQAALGVSVSAVTLPLTYAGVLQQCDIYLNAADFAWSTTTPTPSGSSDVETLVLHEVGHCQGLDHTNVDLADVMYPVAPVGAQKRALQPRDAAQLCYRYPASNGLGSPCDGGTGSCGTGSLKCVPVAQPDGGVKHMCSQGCALMQGGQCDIPFVCTASSAFSPQYAGACLPPDNSVTQVGKPCTQSSQCGSANAICFLENQPNPLPSGAPAWKDGYCTHNCGTGQPGCPAGSACLDIGGGQLFCLKECRLGGGDCRPGYTCVLPSSGGSGVCVSSCAADRDCNPPNQNVNQCRVCDGTCLERQNPSAQIGDVCTSSENCGLGQVCIKQTGSSTGICSQSCARACTACPTGSRCHPVGTKGELFCLRDCSSNNTCPQGLQCATLPTGNACTFPCRSDAECPVGTTCVAGQCSRPTVDDGGCALCQGPTDGGKPTQGAPDAGGGGPGHGTGGCGCQTEGGPLGLYLWMVATCAMLLWRRR